MVERVREEVLWLLDGGNAHICAEAALDRMPLALCGVQPDGVPFTVWRLLEHMRIAQWDILEFCRSGVHVSPEFPSGYWPEEAGPANAAAWEAGIARFLENGRAFRAMIADSTRDLFEPIAWGDGQTLLREALLLADHNAYHLGQVITVRRALGAWSG